MGAAITVAGMDPAKEGAAFREVLGIQLQESRLPDKMSVIEALDLYASFYPEPHDPAELLERLGLVEQRKTYFAKLSGGQKQRLSVALALDRQPEGGDPRRAHHRPGPGRPSRSLGAAGGPARHRRHAAAWFHTSWRRPSGCATG